MQHFFCLQLGPVRALHRASPRDQTRAKQLARFSAIIAETESRALCLHNGRSLQTKKLRPPGRFALLTCSSYKRAIVLFCKYPQPSCQTPTFESRSVYCWMILKAAKKCIKNQITLRLFVWIFYSCFLKVFLLLSTETMTLSWKSDGNIQPNQVGSS